MRFYSKLNERELDPILAGKATGGDFADVATFFRELRSLEQPPSPSVEGRHLAAILEEASRRPSFAPDPQIPVRRARRLSNPFRRLAARATIAAVGLAALAAFGGAAYAGVLPTPIQVEVAHIIRHVGIDLPGNSHHSQAPSPHITPVTSTTANPPQPGQGSFGQGAGTQGNSQGNEGQSADSQGNDGHSGGGQGNSTQTTDGRQGSSQSGNSGSKNTATNGNQGAQPSTGQGQPNEQGTQSLPNDQATTNGDARSGSDQQGNGAFSGNGN